MLPKISSPAMMFLIFALVPGPEATPQAIQSFNKPRRTNPERERRMRALAFRVRLCQVSALAINGWGNHTPGEAVLNKRVCIARCSVFLRSSHANAICLWTD